MTTLDRGLVADSTYTTLLCLKGISPKGTVVANTYASLVCLGPMEGRLNFDSYATALLKGDVSGQITSESYFDLVITGKFSGRILAESYAMIYLMGGCDGSVELKNGAKLYIAGRTTEADLSRVKGQGSVFVEDSDLSPGEHKIGNLSVTVSENSTSGTATEHDDGRFHLVRGRITWIGSIDEPFVYDDYDKHFFISWGDHIVVLPKPVKGFWDFYGQRTLSPGVGRMDVSGVRSTSGNVAMPGALDLPAYQLLLQPSAQRALNLSQEQRSKLLDISAKYWPERRKIAGKELADLETSKQGELAEYSAKARHGIVQSSPGGSNGVFSQNVVEKLERQWSNARKQIEDVLTPEQLRKLKDLTFRTFAFGSGAMFEPEVLDKLGASKKQRDELRTLEGELQKEKRRRIRSVTREKIAKMLAVLTPEQLSHLREKQSLDQYPECSSFPYPGLPSHMPDTGVAEELGFSKEQREHVRKIVTTHWTTLGTFQQEEQNLSLENDKAFKAIGERRRQEMADLRKQIEATLTPKQWASCKEMAFQNLAIVTLQSVVHDAQAAKGIGLDLSEQQMADLRKIEAEYFDKPEQIYCELTDRALAAFTPAQQDKLRAEVDRRGW
jgi:hypothetical protein